MIIGYARVSTEQQSLFTFIAGICQFERDMIHLYGMDGTGTYALSTHTFSFYFKCSVGEKKKVGKVGFPNFSDFILNNV